MGDACDGDDCDGAAWACGVGGGEGDGVVGVVREDEEGGVTA